jgi:hypothetical protein
LQGLRVELLVAHVFKYSIRFVVPSLRLGIAGKSDRCTAITTGIACASAIRYCMLYKPCFRLATRYSSMSPSSTLSQSLRSMLVRKSLIREASSTYERIW